MEKQQSKSSVVTVLVILMVGLGLIAGCSNKKSETAESSDTATSEQQAMEKQQTMAGTQTFNTSLADSNEVPAVTSDASGMATVTLQGDSIHIKGKFSGLSGKYVGSHIHKGAEGENGSPILTLEPTLGSDSLSGSWDASYALNASQISALKADSLYINVHSTEHKPGEIRGQLTSSSSGM